MIFNSVPFVIFFTAVFLIYWFPLKNNTKLQNLFLLIASWFFYGYSNWKILPILILAGIIYFFLGKAIGNSKSEKEASVYTTIGVILGVGTLLYFKYFNFFIESFSSLFETCGLKSNLHTFNIIMPLGISFFTFRLLSYVIDINRGKATHTDDFVAFSTYISFFPCLLSGPIDRPKFIKQLESSRKFDYDQAVDGCRQILWGMFKKIVVADNCATYVDAVWGNLSGQTGSTLALSAILYLFQIYADFSGYSDMAIGVGKLLGFKIADNFKYPLFALNIADYWRRWHITLTQWLTDYVFMPLNIKFRDLGDLGMILSIIITFLLIGMWHGANWTFAIFGLYHGLLYIPLILSGAFFKKSKIQTNKLGLPVFSQFCQMLLTFLLVTIGLIIFRAENVSQAWVYMNGICDLSLFSMPWLKNQAYYIPQFLFVALMICVEWLQRDKSHGLVLTAVHSKPVRYLIYSSFIILMIWVGSQAETYIYVQF